MKYLLPLLILFASCKATSPKVFTPMEQAYDFRSGDKQGVRFKRGIDPKQHRWITLMIFSGIIIFVTVKTNHDNH